MYKITVPTVITNGHFNREKTLAELKRCGADRVALAIDRELDYAFSSPENLRLLGELVTYYRENGLEILVWLGETLGHDGMAMFDTDYTRMRAFGHGDELVEIGSFCPLDEKFTADFCTWVKKVAQCGPDMILLDDDFRLSNREGVITGCCCDKHLQLMEKKLGTKIDRNSLKKQVSVGGENKYRDAFLDSQKDAMEGFARALRTAVDEVDPTIRLSFCACTGSYGNEGWDAYEVSRIMAGGTKPFLRTIAAPYWTMGCGNTLGEILETQRSQLGKMPDGEVFVEGDTYPRPRTNCPAAYLECYDMILRADGRADGILKYMLDYVADADYETGYIDAMVANESTYRAISELFDGGKCTGVKPYLSRRAGDKLGLFERPALVSPAFRFVSQNALPTTYEDGYVNVIFREHAHTISKEELKNGSIIDITAAKILMERGIDVGIEEIIPDSEYTQKGFTDLPQEYFLEEDCYVRLWHGVRPCKVNLKAGCRVLSEYVYGQKARQVADFEYENADGMRFRVMTFDAGYAALSMDWLSTYAKRRSLVKSIKWLGKPLDASPVGNYPNLYLLTKEKGTHLCVGAWNLCPDKIEHLKLHIEKEFKEVRFIGCTGHREDDVIVLDSVLYPYEFAGLEIERE